MIARRSLTASLLIGALGAWALFHAPAPVRAAGAGVTPYLVQHVADLIPPAVPQDANLFEATVPIPAGVQTNDTLVVSIAALMPQLQSPPPATAWLHQVSDSQNGAYTLAAVDSITPAGLVSAVAVSSFDARGLDGDRGDAVYVVLLLPPVDVIVSVDEYSGVEAVDSAGATHSSGSSASLSLTPSDAPELFVGVVGAISAGAPALASGWRSSASLGSGPAGEQFLAASQALGSTSPASLAASSAPDTVWTLSGATLYADGEHVSAAAPTVSTGICAGGTMASIAHVVLVLDENHSAAQIMPKAAAKNIKSLAKQCGYAHNFAAASHPSLPNYLALTGGLAPTRGDCNPLNPAMPSAAHCPGLPYTSHDLFGTAASSKSYLGNMKDGSGTLADCQPADWEEASAPTHTYAAHHNPQLYFSDSGITASGATPSCAGQVSPPVAATNLFLDDFSEAASNYDFLKNTGCLSNCLPAFTLIVLDNEENMHDGGVGTGDTQIGYLVDALTANASYGDGSTVILLSWDEGQKIKCPTNDPNTTPCGSKSAQGKPIVPQDKPCYNPDSAAITNTTPELLNLTAPKSGVAGAYIDDTLLPQSCMVPLVVLNKHLATDGSNVGTYGTGGATGASAAFHNHYDLLYSILKLLKLSTTGYPALAASGVDTWTHSTNCTSACHSPSNFLSGYFGLVPTP